MIATGTQLTATINLANDASTLTRVIYAVDLHDTFSLAMAYLQSWGLPCLVAYRHSNATVTGIELLVIEMSAAVNWIGHATKWQHHECFSASMDYTSQQMPIVLWPPRRPPPAVAAPHTTPQPKRTPKTQLWVQTTLCAPPCIRWPSQSSAMDSDESSLI